MPAATHDDDTCLVIHDAPAPGTWNMAVDEALVEAAERLPIPVLRFYTWCEPTLSLGYFQDLRRRSEHVPSLSCALVRRTTGGGAILHHRELTYSLTVAVKHRMATDALSLYRRLHGALAQALAVQGIRATLREAVLPNAPPARPFLCFLRQGEGDLLVGSHKVAGSAQRRLRGAVLQHGSVLWAASACAPELPGLADLAGGPLDRPRMVADWLECLSTDWQVRLAFGPLPPGVRERAAALVRERYATEQWLWRR